ncbi:MAG TPA: hypothetical protein VH413_18350 [Verrucomicrobiae bacterium]|nr:hypothetical protein [Verrucomicrobiae bacterium]
MQKILRAAFLFLFLLTPFIATPQTNPPAPTSRFLFIVDTSAPLQAHAADILKVINDLLVSAANGQIHAGDSIGLWTFDQDVHSDLPLQVWPVTGQAGIAQRTTDFLKLQLADKTPRPAAPPSRGKPVFAPAPPPAKPSRLDLVLPDLFNLIQVSDTITVFLISTGDAQMRGTPFDSEINSQYQQDVKDMRGNRMPIVTILQARGGKILHYTLNALPWPIVMPQPLLALSAPIVARKTPTPAPPVVAKPTPAPTPALIITAAPKPTPPAVTPPPEVPKTNSPAVEPANVTPPAPVHHEQPPQTIAKVEAEPVPPPHKETPPPVVIEKPEVSMPTPPQTENTEKPELTPKPVAATPPPVTSPGPVERPTPKPVTISPAPIPPAAASAALEPQLAIASPQTAARPKILLIAGAVLAAIAIALIVIIILRSRETGPSLITRSMGNRKK